MKQQKCKVVEAANYTKYSYRCDCEENKVNEYFWIECHGSHVS